MSKPLSLEIPKCMKLKHLNGMQSFVLGIQEIFAIKVWNLNASKFEKKISGFFGEIWWNHQIHIYDAWKIWLGSGPQLHWIHSHFLYPACLHFSLRGNVHRFWHRCFFWQARNLPSWHIFDIPATQDSNHQDDDHGCFGLARIEFRVGPSNLQFVTPLTHLGPVVWI